MSAWSTAGFEVACNCTITSTCSPYISYKPVPVADVLVLENATEASGLSKKQKVGIGVGVGALALDQIITQGWFHLSKRIQQARIRYASQALAATLGLGLPLVQLVPGCIGGLRGKRASHTLFPAKAVPDLTAQ